MTTTASPDLLEAIVSATRRIVAHRQERLRANALEVQASKYDPSGVRFQAALAPPDRINIIAECKRRSPSRGVLRKSYDPVAIARRYHEEGAVAISVLTESTFFDGSLEHLRAVRQAVPLPLLRKDFIVDPYQLLEARAGGADAVLLIAATLSDTELIELHRQARALGLAALVEVHDAIELERALSAGAEIVGVNNRNLRTLEVDPVISLELAAQIPTGVISVTESGLQSAEDLQRLRVAGYRAFLVGERFMTATDPGAALRSVMGAS
jgi:indole-3-glycerol phosphate synthase